MAYRNLGKPQEALSYHQRALPILEKTYGKEHPDIAVCLNNIGMAYGKLGKAPRSTLLPPKSSNYQRKDLWQGASRCGHSV